MRWIICLLITFVVFANSYAAGIYKCADDKGRTLFSQTPSLVSGRPTTCRPRKSMPK